MRGVILMAVCGMLAASLPGFVLAAPAKLPLVMINQTIEGVRVKVPVASTVDLPAPDQQRPTSVQVEGDLSDIQAKFADIVSRVPMPNDKCGDRLRLSNATLTPAGSDALATATLHYERWFCSGGLKLKTRVVAQKADVCVTARPEIVNDTEIKLQSTISCVKAHGFAKAVVAIFQQQLAEMMTGMLRDAIGGDKLRFALPPEILRHNPRILTAVFTDRGDGKLGALATAEATLDQASLASLLAKVVGRPQ